MVLIFLWHVFDGGINKLVSIRLLETMNFETLENLLTQDTSTSQKWAATASVHGIPLVVGIYGNLYGSL